MFADVKERPKCVGCATAAPETNTNHTLISSEFGWRITRTKRPDGTIGMEWRCAECWRKHKAAAVRRP